VFLLKRVGVTSLLRACTTNCNAKFTEGVGDKGSKSVI